MQYALVDGERRLASPGSSKAACCLCEGPVRPKCGSRIVWHWAHHARPHCDPWWEPESEWHRAWKARFPESWREQVQFDPQVAIPPRARELLEKLGEGPRGEFVFMKERGGTGPLKYIRAQFMIALAKGGIKDFRFHDLRHTAVSYMMMNGIDLKTISELVGHTTAEMVDQRYGHLSPDHKRMATEIFGSAMDRLTGLANAVRK